LTKLCRLKLGGLGSYVSRCGLESDVAINYRLMLANGGTVTFWLEVTQDHWKWYLSKAWIRFPIHLL